MAATRALEHLLFSPLSRPLSSFYLTPGREFQSHSHSLIATRRKKKKKKDGEGATNIRSSGDDKEARSRSLLLVKKRTRSDLKLDQTQLEEYGSSNSHVPVMLGEVVNVFHRPLLRSFVDCTLGAAGHSSAIIRSHPEMRVFVGLDTDPTALEMSRACIEQLMDNASCSGSAAPSLRVHTRLSNFKHIKSVVGEVDDGSVILDGGGADGILMDLGMSSMQVDNPERGFSILADGPLDMRMNPQASLTAEDILNSWPEAEVGRIIREYGEESNWKLLQRKIMNARACGGLHSTTDLVKLIQSMPLRSGGRHGWIKTAARLFQALRIAVNDELKTLEIALYACFDCLSSGGRLAVISFHSLEDRIVKHTFLDIIRKFEGDGKEVKSQDDDIILHEKWSKGTVAGKNGIILTKRPITPSTEEEKLNPRSRSAKLRVLQKL